MNTEADYFLQFELENPVTFDATTLGCDKKMNQYLANRLHHAFECGASAGRKLERERLHARALKSLFGES
jgi:hypothetical protein